MKLAQTIPGCVVFNRNQEVGDTSEFVFIATGDDYVASVCAGIEWRMDRMWFILAVPF